MSRGLKIRLLLRYRWARLKLMVGVPPDRPPESDELDELIARGDLKAVRGEAVPNLEIELRPDPEERV